MAIKIETKPVTNGNGRDSQKWHEFLVAMKGLKVGQSFLIGEVASNHRLAVTAAKVWLDASFKIVREGKQFRVGRIA